jgi:S-formylglutathione hydrolase FrmB
MKQTRFALRLCAALLLCALASALQAQGIKLSVRYTAEAFPGPFQGRVVVFFSTTGAEPRFGPNWFRPEPMFSKAFQAIKPGEPMVLDDTAVGFPGRLSELKAGEYLVQAVVDRNLGGRRIGDSPGNLYSEPVKVTVDSPGKGTIDLVCNKVAGERAFQETDTVKEVRLESKLLSRFYGRPTRLNAAVALPEAWSVDPRRKFPIVFEIPGFGGRHYSLSGATRTTKTNRAGEPFLYVMLDPDCPTGHSVFADSANNGPWGEALTTELIPEIERRFRAVGKPAARFVTGHSSGGWSSLWLQVAYPDVFGGCWSTSPDPVDFRDFQRIDLYAPDANMFTDSAGQPRPLARRGDTPILLYRAFSDMERPLRGEQLGSFEAVFSPRGPDGEPRKLWDRDTGAIDPKVAQYWRRYDIDLLLRTHWKEMGPKLQGKLHVYTGDKDTFYLEGAVKRLREDLQKLGSDAKVELFPGDHGSVMTLALRTRIDTEMAEQYRQHLQKPQ